MMHRFPMALLSLLAVAPATAHAQTPAAVVPALTELVVGQDDFRQLRWIEGRWHGEADGQPGVYERYRFLDDSTLSVETFGDAKFAAAQQRHRVELRGHRVVLQGANGQWVLTGMDSVSAAFRPLAGMKNGLLWQRQSTTEWIAVRTWPPTVDQPAKVVKYQMKRMSGK